MTVRILHGDVREVLATLPDGLFDCIVTSPPYWGLRDYGVAGQIGLEPTLNGYLDAMTDVCRELRRVLKPEGTFWLNVGDSYCSTDKWGGGGNVGKQTVAPDGSVPAWAVRQKKQKQEGLKPKDLCMVPNRLAIRLQEDGWYVRSEIIWHKPNPMPESVRDRPTNSHEKVWLLTKSDCYFYDADAIAESAADTSLARWAQPSIDGQAGSTRQPGNTNGAMKAVGGARRPQAIRAVELAREKGLTEAHIAAIRAVGITDAGKAQTTQSGCGKNDPAVQALADEAKAALGGYFREFLIAERRNARNVWTIATQPFKEAHFATMAPELAERCIKAGCPLGGCVLDPFGGAGTTGLVADRLGRNATLIELNPEYIAIARRRIENDAPLFAEVSA